MHWLVSFGFRPKDVLQYSISRDKLHSVLRLAHRMNRYIHPAEVQRVLLSYNRGAKHQQFLDNASVQELARWALNRASPWATIDDDDDDIEAMIAGII